MFFRFSTTKEKIQIRNFALVYAEDEILTENSAIVVDLTRLFSPLSG